LIQYRWNARHGVGQPIPDKCAFRTKPDTIETAAIRNEAVNLVTHLALVIDVSNLIVDVPVAPETFQAVLMSHIQGIDSHLLSESNPPSYLLSDLEEAVSAGLIEIGKSAGLSPHYGSDILSQVNKLTVKLSFLSIITDLIRMGIKYLPKHHPASRLGLITFVLSRLMAFPSGCLWRFAGIFWPSISQRLLVYLRF
jgi:hypothetical protein